jgi:hypothetical protein
MKECKDSILEIKNGAFIQENNKISGGAIQANDNELLNAIIIEDTLLKDH